MCRRLGEVQRPCFAASRITFVITRFKISVFREGILTAWQQYEKVIGISTLNAQSDCLHRNALKIASSSLFSEISEMKIFVLLLDRLIRRFS